MTTQEEAEAALEPLVRQALDEYLTALREAVLVDSVTAAAFLPDRWGDASRVWFDAIRRLVFPVVSDLFGEAFAAFARSAVISDIPYREAYLERVFSRLKLFPGNLFEDIRPEIAEAVAEGEPIDQIADRVEAFLDFDQAKDATGPDQAAARAARAEINQIERQLDDPATPSSELGELRRRRRDAYEREAEALDRYRYKAERIARTEAVAALNAGAFDGAAGRAEITGEVLYKEWLCVVPDTEVSGIGITHVAARPYTGVTVSLTGRSSSGSSRSTPLDRTLTVTPNHPVLTRRGWIRADQVKEGDHLIRYSRADRDTLGDPDIDHKPSTADQVFSAAHEVAAGPGMVRVVVDLDSDVPDSHVHVVPVHADLSAHLEPARLQPADKVVFTMSDVVLSDLVSSGSLDQLGVRNRSRSSGQPTMSARLDRDLPPGGTLNSRIGRGHLRPDQTRFGLTAETDPGVGKNAGDRGLAGTDSATDALEALAGFIEFDDVISVEVRAFSGHVYDLSTSCHWFLGNGYVIHNSASDDRTRESHVLANGQVRPMLAPFDVGGSSLMFPGDPTGPAQEVIQCRCTILIHDADELTGDQVDNLTAALPEGAQLPDGWRGTLVPLNMPSGDGRTLMTPIGGVRTRQHPIPFLWQERSAPGHDGAVVVGRIDRVWTENGILMGEGPFGTDQNSQDAARFLASGMANGISVDPDEISFVMDPDSDQVLFTDWRLAAATMVGIQAFDEARIEPIYGYVPAEAEQVEEPVLIASLPGHVYDSGWFADPQLSQHTPVTITEDGRIFGHLAEWNTCHVGIGDVCTVAPPSVTSYAYFHTGEIRTDAGRLAVGKITVGGGHADTRLGYRPASNHYDDATTAVAVIRAGEDEFGIWVAGSVLPDATGAQVDALLRSPLSGDWRKIGGNLELMAALAVNTPGFPVVRDRELVQTYSLIAGAQVDGEQVSLIITGGTPERESQLVGFDYEKAADAIVAAMKTQQRREGRRAVALARAGRDVSGRFTAVMQRIGG